MFLLFVVGFKTAAGWPAGGTVGKSRYLKNTSWKLMIHNITILVVNITGWKPMLRNITILVVIENTQAGSL